MKIYGLLDCPLRGVGSKSEGTRAILTDAEGREYKLYRAGAFAVSDSFFLPYAGMNVTVSGTDEPRTGNFRVESILLEDGTEVVPEPPVLPEQPDLPEDFRLHEEESVHEATVESKAFTFRRLPSRMKKKLKMIKKFRQVKF